MSLRKVSSTAPPTQTSEGGGEKLQLKVALLRVIEGPDQHREVALAAAPLVIGSHAACGLRLSDPTVSAQHAEIALDEHGFALRDLGSKNGTRVNGLRATRVYLAPGAQLRVGRTAIEVVDAGRVQEYELSARRSFGRLVGGSLPMRQLYALLESAAGTDLTVLIEGETGTGKSLVAEELHRHGGRASGPFEVCECGAVPAGLIESLLFGHERGAFTGAEQRSIGIVERADGGTLFLDEVSELPLELQPTLLRLVEAREFMRVGDRQRRAVNLRIIAATNRDLEHEVARGRFRQDLFYRLAVVRVRVPALRERLDDLPVLVERLARSIASEVDLGPQIPLLASHHWPGNVRELRNVVERLAVMPPTAALPTALRPAAERQSPFAYQDARDRALAQFERVFVISLLRQTGGNVTRAAELAGLSRRYLTELLTKHGIDRRSALSDD